MERVPQHNSGRIASADRSEAARYNIDHADRLSPKDKKRIARDIASTDPECKWTEDALAKKLGVIRQTVNTWISDIRARQKASRNTVILRLNRLGWPQEQIAEKAGLNQQRVSQITNNANFGNIGNLLAQGHDMDYIAKHYNEDAGDPRRTANPWQSLRRRKRCGILGFPAG